MKDIDMKRLLITFLMMVGWTVHSNAESNEAVPQTQGKRIFSKQEILALFDMNKDGHLSNVERQAGLKSIHRIRDYRRIREASERASVKSGSKSVSSSKSIRPPSSRPKSTGVGNVGNVRTAASAQTAKSRPSTSRSNLIQQYDKDGDGRLNEQERAALRESFTRNARAKR
jgi:hypothetical protein